MAIPFFVMKRWKMVLFFGRQVQNPMRQMRFLFFFSVILCFNFGSMLSPADRPWASASHYTVSVYCSINSFPHLVSGEAEQCSGHDVLIMWNVACWFKFSSLVQRHFAVFFFWVTLVWLQPAGKVNPPDISDSPPVASEVARIFCSMQGWCSLWCYDKACRHASCILD